QTFFSKATLQQMISALRRACKRHVELTRECSKGLCQHQYAIYCLLQHELETSSDISPSSSGVLALPEIFRDGRWALSTSIVLSALNYGNPALHPFSFRTFSPHGYALRQIIKDDGLSVCAPSKQIFPAVCSAFAIVSSLRPCSVAL
ncbi:hypothetical protein EDB85DRAFT_1874869, partial [Lactarius pseudohatsudake]